MGLSSLSKKSSSAASRERLDGKRTRPARVNVAPPALLAASPSPLPGAASSAAASFLPRLSLAALGFPLCAPGSDVPGPGPGHAAAASEGAVCALSRGWPPAAAGRLGRPGRLSERPISLRASANSVRAGSGAAPGDWNC